MKTMMEAVENPKLVKRKMGMQGASVPDNFVQCKKDEPENFLIDMNNFSYVNEDDSSANSRTGLKQGFSGKMSSEYGNEKKVIHGAELYDKTDLRGDFFPSSTPKVSDTVESPGDGATAGTVQGSSPRIHHQIAISTSNIKFSAEGRGSFRRSSSTRRSSHSWILNPRNILLFFATMSSMGTMILIYLTLSAWRPSAESTGSALDLLQ